MDTAFSAVPTNGDVYEHLPYHPDDMIDAIHEALRQSFPDIYVPLIDETLKVDELLSNWDFETFTVANTPDDWSLVNLAAGSTITKETARVIQGTSSVKLAPTAGDATISQNVFDSIEINEMSGKSFYASKKVWYNGASVVKLRVSFDNGSTFTDSSNHSGLSEWQRLEVRTSIPSTATTALVYLFVTNNETCYLDDASTHAGTISKYTIPATFINGVHKVSIQADINDPSGYYQPLTADIYVPPGHIIRLEGKGRLTAPALTSAGAGTATTEIDDAQSEFIIANAARILFNRLASDDTSNSDEHLQRSARWAGEAERLRGVPGTRSRRMAADKPLLGERRFGSDSSGNYLSLPR